MNSVKNYFLILLATTVLLSCGDSEEGVKVKGKILNPSAEGAVLLSIYNEKGLVPLDTIEIAEDGSFKFFVKVDQPSFYRVVFYDKKVANLILDGTEEKVEIAIDMNEAKANPTIEGSPQTAHLAVYDRLVNNMKEDQELLNAQARQASQVQDQAELEALQNEFMTLLDDFYDEVKRYSHQIKPSIAVFYGIGSLKLDEHFDFYDSLAGYYERELPEHIFTKNLVTSVSQMRQQVDRAKALGVGAQAPEIRLPTPDGGELTLASLRGKYVLIDFWAAWCRPCRMENPNVVRVYNQYKNKNFEILGVSLDRDRPAWLGAIEKDGLTWKHVSDLQYFNSQAAQDYQIQSIPATVLVDPDGKIIAKGLRGPSLEAKLKEIFG